MSSFEIQNLKEQLAAAQKQGDKYAHLIASLSYELNTLRNNICHTCKKKLVSVSAIAVSAPFDGHGPASSTPASTPLLRRIFQGRQRTRPPSLHTKALPASLEVEVAQSPSTHRPTLPGSKDENIMSPKRESEPLKWSVVYDPQVKRTLDIHLVHEFTYESPVYCAKISPDGQRLAIGLSNVGKTYINELKVKSNICVFVDRSAKELDPISMLNVQFSPDGQLLATGATDKKIRIWDITQRRTRVIFNGHKSTVKNTVFSPNGRLLVSGSNAHSVRLWNLRDGSSKILPTTGNPSFFITVSFSPNGRYIAGGDFDNSLWIWDSRTCKLVAKWRGHTSSVCCAEFTPDGKGLMSGGLDKAVKYWDLSLLGTQVLSTVDEEQSFPEIRSFSGHNSAVRSIVFLPHSQWIVTSSDDHSVRVWDIQSGVCQLTLQGNMGLWGVDASQTPDFLVTTGNDNHVRLWRYEVL